jgi:hypothetical protein
MLGEHSIEPGQKAVLKVWYNTLNFPGPFEKSVTVFTDIPDQPSLVISLKGTVQAMPMGKIQVEPRKIELGAIKPGTVVTPSVTIANIGNAPLVIDRIQACKGNTVYFDGQKEGPLEIPAGGQRDLQLQIAAPQAGNLIEAICIQSNARNSGKRGYVIMAMGKVEG